MGMADAATVLWTRFLKHDPADPNWPDRDRFVLSAGHGSMLLYSLLHLSGYDLSLDDLRQFRQLGSRTPGHPEVGHTAGVETTTGPLGQGFANGVGLAMAERMLRETFGSELCDHFIYGIVSDGDLMEGIATEAASLAGHLGLGRIVYLYDDNHISIDGPTELSFTEDVAAKFVAMGWHVQKVDGHDPEAVATAIAAARAEAGRPSLIAARTVIGHGSPSYQGTARTHGEALGADEVRRTKVALGLDPDVTFAVPKDALDAFREGAGPADHAAWRQRLSSSAKRDEWLAWTQPDWVRTLSSASWPRFEGKVATRKAFAACLKAVSAVAPWLVGGSADLTGSNGVAIGATALTPDRFAGARSVHWGVREHAMGGACNGIALHGGVRPYCATFLVFHDYHRPSVRLSALMGQPVLWIYSHDSVFLGEDGPTHQPIETLLALRAIPGMVVWRPADANETAASLRASLLHTTGPSAVVLTRQDLPVLPGADGIDLSAGAWLVRDVLAPSAVLVATGSEVSAALAAADLLQASDVRVRVVSMPSRERFLAADAATRNALLPVNLPRVTIEAATTKGWECVAGDGGLRIGIDRFGASAPAAQLAELFGLTPAAIADRVRGWLQA